MKQKADRSWSRYWVADDAFGIELLHARFLGQRFVPHTHDTFTVGVILDGALGFDHERRQGVAPTGCVSVVNPGEIHTGYGAGEEGWAYRNFFLPAPLMRGIAADLGVDELPFFSQTVLKDRRIARSLLHLHCLLDDRLLDGDKKLLGTSTMTLERESTILTVLAELISSYAIAAAPKSEPAAPESILKAVQRMHDEFSLPLTLEELAAETGLNRFQFLRLFRRRVGLTPHAYLLQIRIDQAKERLLQGQPIAEVAADCGFFDQSHLSRRCKEVFGVTPGALAQAVKKPPRI